VTYRASEQPEFTVISEEVANCVSYDKVTEVKCGWSVCCSVTGEWENECTKWREESLRMENNRLGGRQ
jgi:hypothetical protein